MMNFWGSKMEFTKNFGTTKRKVLSPKKKNDLYKSDYLNV